MDILTSAADAILKDDTEMILTPTKENTRPVFRDLSNNTQIISSSPNHLRKSSLITLLNERITANSHTSPALNLKTPRKRRKNSSKYGDENQAPSPKTPKNDHKFDFSESPVTPLSNLKMLTRIASMEEHIPSKKDLFSNPPPSCKSKIKFRRCVSDFPSNLQRNQQSSKPKLKKYTSSSDIEQSQSQEENYKKVQGIGGETSRREKSLGLLCEKFLQHFPMEVSFLETPRRLVIDDVASVLGTERRRVYDIVNILECLNMASRVQKNMYQWMGNQHLETTLCKLKGLAEEWGISAQFREPVEKSILSIKSGKTLSPISLGERVNDSRKEKSIGILCQKFLMLFLISDPPHIIQLETANHLLLGQEGDDIDKLRKRGRRIYDIANVLVALRLITKLPQCKSFKYIGPSVEAVKTESDNKIKLRHSLLPPPMSELVREKNSLHHNEDHEVTPEDNINGCNVSKKGRPGRKLASEFVHSKAKRNCLIVHTKSEDSLPRKNSAIVKNCSSLQDVSQKIDENKVKGTSLQIKQENGYKMPTMEKTLLNQRSNVTKIFKFTHHGSPRMALTFNDNSSILRSPPIITDKLPLTENNVSKVIVRPPYILRRVNASTSSPQANAGVIPPQINENSTSKQMFTNCASNTPNIEKSQNPPLVKAVGTRSFKVYSNSNKSTSLSPVTGNNVRITSPVFIQSNSSSNQPKVLMKSLSQIVLPSINFNTLSKNHYRIGTSTHITNPTLETTNGKGAYRFIINSKNNQMAKTQSDPGKELKEPSFVKMLDNSPDQSSTDSELESIFGDTFNFPRPKSLVRKS